MAFYDGTTGGQAGERKQLQGLIDSMLDERNISKGVGDNFTRSERRARIGSRRIQAQERVANMLSGLSQVGMQQAGNTERTAMSNHAKLRDRAMAETGQTERTAMNNDNTLANTAALGINALNLDKQRNNNLVDLEERRNVWDKEKDNRGLVQSLASAGVPIGAKMNNAYNTPGEQSLDLVGIGRPSEQHVVDPQFVKPQYDEKKGKLLEGTGRWYKPGQNVGGDGALGLGSFTQDDVIIAQNKLGKKFDYNNPTPEQAEYLKELAQSNPALVRYLRGNYIE